MANQSQQVARLVQEVLRLTRGRLGMRWTLALAAALIAYVIAQPYLERSLGVSLPGLAGSQSTELPSEPAAPQPSATPSGSPATVEDPRERLTSVLREVGRDVYQSPAGLRYTRGSQHGHRLKHLMAHTRDDPDRPGQHGVFDSDDPKEVVLLIDEAFTQAESGRRTEVERDDGRVIYTVDLGRRIGYVGGQSGARRGHPAATHMKLVVQGKNVITAFPLRP